MAPCPIKWARAQRKSEEEEAWCRHPPTEHWTVIDETVRRTIGRRNAIGTADGDGTGAEVHHPDAVPAIETGNEIGTATGIGIDAGARLEAGPRDQNAGLVEPHRMSHRTAKTLVVAAAVLVVLSYRMSTLVEMGP